MSDNQDKNILKTLELLQSESTIDQLIALSELAKLSNPDFILLLIDFLKKEDYAVRVKVISILVNHGQEAVQPLIAALTDENPNIRKGAAEALGVIKDKRATEALLQALHDADESVCGNVITALGQIGDSDSFDELLKLVFANERGVRNTAIRAVKRFNNNRVVEPILNSLIEANFEIGRKDFGVYVTTLSSFTDEQSLTLILDALPKVPQYLMPMLIQVIGLQKNNRAILPLIELLKLTDDTNIIVTALQALGELKAAEALEVIVQLLNNKKEDIRVRAIMALGELDNPGIIDLFAQILSDNAPKIRAQAAASLYKKNDLFAVNLLLEALTDSDELVRNAAWGSLGKIKVQEVDVILAGQLQSDDPLARNGAARALSFRSLLGNLTKLDAEIVNTALVEAITDPDYGVRMSAVHALAHSGNPNSLINILKCRNDEKDLVRVAVAVDLKFFKDSNEALDNLKTLLGDESWKVRYHAAQSLGNFNRSTVMEDLVKALDDENGTVRYEAVNALRRVGDHSVLDKLRWVEEHDKGENLDHEDVASMAKWAIVGILGRQK